MKMKKKIGIVTGTRAEYGLLEKIIQLAYKSEQLDPIVYVTGMHLLSKFGQTQNDILPDGKIKTCIIEMYDENLLDHYDYVAQGLSNAIIKFTHQFHHDNTQIILVLGDRTEPLAAVIAAATLNIPIAHIHGGDISENAQIDEQIRHAITKFAHIHFAATELSKKRILQMGEEPWRVFNVGAPGLDRIFEVKLLSKIKLLEELNIDSSQIGNKPLILCVYHPEITDSIHSGEKMAEILEILDNFDYQVVVLYPNNDPGSNSIIEAIESYRDNPKFHIFKNLPRIVYLSVMKHSLFMIGNSSSGIIESTPLHVPVINIGIRNLNRECSGNILTISHSKTEIFEAIKKVTNPRFIAKVKMVASVYGNGTSSQKIIDILESLHIDEKLLTKKFILFNGESMKK